MHKRIGAMLEEINKHRIEDVVYNLAHHYYEGRSDEKTLIYATMAGEKATQAFAPEDALSYYNMGLEALDRLEKSKENQEKKIELLKRLGEISFNLSEWKPALDYYKKSIKLCEEVKDAKGRAESLRKMGYVFNRMGNWKFASMKFEPALKISENLDDKHGIADAHRGLGYIHWRMGQYDEAIEHYNQCIEFSMWVGDMHTIALTFIELGNVYTETGDSDKAIEYYFKALKELEPIHDYSEMARAYNNLGDTHLKSESYEMAIAYFEKCEVMGRRIGRKDIVGWSLFNKGEAWALKGDSDKALECAERSLNILKTVGDKLGIQACYKIFGMAYGMKKEWDKAIENFNTFVKLGDENQVPYILGEGHYHFGRMYLSKGDKENAKEQLEKAKEIFKTLNAEEFVLKVEKQLEGL
jgi:tetratricopeptide (TPR) repeat protein